MSAINQIIELLGRLPMDVEGRAVADRLILDSRKELALLVAKVQEYEWHDIIGGEDSTAFNYCPDCGQFDFKGHKQNCELAALLSKFTDKVSYARA